MRRAAPVLLALPALVLLTLAGCTSTGAGHSSASRPATPSTPATATSSTSVRPSTPARPSTPSGSTSARPGGAAAVLAAMTLRERVGQLLMVDCPSDAVPAATRTAVRSFAAGSVILDGTTHGGSAATRRVTAQLQALAPQRAGLLVATDQEGGLVQRLQGPGFDAVPSAVEQGRLATAALQADARRWGTQLRRAGVTVDLAPVLDTVPAGGGPNPPIGDLDREYGHTPATVGAHGVAVVRGLLAAGVDPTVKHFPGLGRVSGNTDTTAGVTDHVTTRDDAYLAPFRAAVRAGAPFVMMSTAIYSRLDPGTPAAFSRPIVTGLLRGTLGYRGVVVSDDVGAARQVTAYPPGERAVRVVAAGGDLVLTVVAAQAGEMSRALVAKAQSDPAFRRLVDAAALRVLTAKQRRGLL